MQRIKQFFTQHKEKRAKAQERDSKRLVLDELFNDLYYDRKRIYKLNFVRGITFGIGSAIGGTVAIALIIWILSLFVNTPFIGQLFKETQQAIEQTTNEASQ